LAGSIVGDALAGLFEPADGGCTKEKRLHVLDSIENVQGIVGCGFAQSSMDIYGAYVKGDLIREIMLLHCPLATCTFLC
jgi:hypothetical protein